MTNRWRVVLLAGVLAGACDGQVPAKGWVRPSAGVLAGAIVRAMSDRGIAVRADDVVLLTAVVSSSAAPVLDVVSIAALPGAGRGRSMVRVACHEAGECLPFYAVVNGVESVPEPARAVRVVEPVVMRAGTRATLLMEDGRARVQVAVVSLGSGAAGRVVRVRTADGRQVYSAEIVNATLLRRAF